ncbi:VWA domain-containing protein [Glaciecola sp. KUL10]|uniref:VWA domain-containing protein n=1 Tax=Glaciecola sp. (strain KUL10) TaxID=2161813 RepID=UPI000D78B85C|nr:VWA domain-containing protein [Glaciecola sp. KUL10]GBL03614.1 hypothetical protein KUL10_09140 [Glaciecola sp. KUL10]
MKKTRTPIEVFSLSFLDIISCAFGAVIMLILLAKNGDEGEFNDTSEIAGMLNAVNRAQMSLSELQGALSIKLEELKHAQASVASVSEQAKNLETEVARAQNDVQSLNDQASGLKVIKVEQERAAINAGKAKERVDEVGGIPVDSDYVIFIVDTSGSMKNMWRKVMDTLSETLNNHPEIKGFQILSDNGDPLPGVKLGDWRKDTPVQRRLALSTMMSWNFAGSSNSSPVEGIETALRTYGRSKSLALYVFGDDYNGSSFDKTLENINRLNTDKQGNKIARIHAVGFKPNRIQYGGEPLMFSTVMREVTRQNNGTFLAL